MKICFIMYPWESIDPNFDSTIRLIHESYIRKHTVAITTTNGLTIRESTPMAFCQILKKGVSQNSSIRTFHNKITFKKSMLPLAGFDVIFIRANPPVNLLALSFLESVKSDVFIMNDVDGLRKANSKIYTASLDNHDLGIIPKTYVSKNKEYLQSILKENKKEKMILKPLDGYGGTGVIVVEKSAQQSFKSLLDFYIGDKDNNSYVILQDFIEGAEKGDVRILLLNGEPIGAMRRIPAVDDIRSNIHQGGKEAKHNLTKEEKLICKLIGPQLVRDGLYFVGIDVINGQLLEVNVLSPGGITRINKLNRTKLQVKIIDFLESVYSAKELLNTRKNFYRKVIEDVDNAAFKND